MFGIVRPCRHGLGERLSTEWTAHLCGLCLALRGETGQFSRVATNYDGLIVSVLVEAQAERPGGEGGWRRTAGPCPLRGMRRASVAQGEGARLAAAVSLVLASAKMRDHADDGDGALRRKPVAAAARTVAAGWDRAGARTGAGLGFDTALLTDAVDRQRALEDAAGPGTSVLEVTEPAETATAAAFAHTAVLAGRPGNQEPLAETGRLFGRLAHLLDAVEDLTADEKSGAWNPLAATGTDLREARRLCDDAVYGIRLALDEVEFTDGALARLLLGRELRKSVKRSFRAAGAAGPHDGGRGHGCSATENAVHGAGPHAPQQPNPYAPGGPGGDPDGDDGGGSGDDGRGGRGRRRGLFAGCAVWTGLCVMGQVCCRDPYHDPWNGQSREGWCHKCGDCCDCCDGCNCCDSCSCCDGCDGCDCGCDC